MNLQSKWAGAALLSGALLLSLWPGGHQKRLTLHATVPQFAGGKINGGFGPKPTQSPQMTIPGESITPRDNGDGTVQLSLSFLSQFPCAENPRELPTVPAPIAAYQGKSVRVRGFMVPIDISGNNTHLFALVKNQMSCCYGMAPKLNEWIQVTLEENKTASLSLMDNVIEVQGTLAMGGDEDQKDCVFNLYRIKANQVSAAPH